MKRHTLVRKMHRCHGSSTTENRITTDICQEKPCCMQENVLCFFVSAFLVHCMHFLLMHTINVVYIIGCGQKTQYINMSNRSCIYWRFHGIKTCENKLSAKFLLKLFSINGPYEINVWPHPRLFPFFTHLCSHFASKYYCECKQEDKNRGVLGMRLMNV